MTGTLSVVVPVFNEAATVETVLKAIVRQDLVGEIIVVDDASDILFRND